MKQLFILIAFAIILLSISGFDTQNTENTGNLGDIKYSILPPDEFQEINGDGWKLINGDNINDTYLFEFLSDRNLETVLWKDVNNGNRYERLPDLRNKFIRSMGDKNRRVASEQKFATALPDNFRVEIVANGEHNHNYDIVYKAKSKRSLGKYGALFMNGKKTQTQKSGKHNHQAVVTGGATETRPVNIVFYTYIKVEKE